MTVRNRGTDARPRWFYAYGRKPQRTRGPFPTREQAELAMAEAIANPPVREAPIVPLSSFADYSVRGLLDLIDSGLCDANCLYAECPIEECDCRCAGRYHSRARLAAAVLEDRVPTDPLAALRSWRILVGQEEALVAAARRPAAGDGHSWDAIGEAAGLDPSAVRRRWGVRYPRKGWKGRHRVAPVTLAEISEHHRRAAGL